MTYIITEGCIDLLDKTCIDECPVDCIYEGARQMYIHPDECVDCGACEPVCPVEAIFYEDDLPDDLKDFYRVNVEFFQQSRLSRRCVQGGQDPIRPPDHGLVPTTAALGITALTLSASLPTFPWDLLAPYREKASAHSGGIVDLSIGTPVDPVPPVVRAALAEAADAPGYPTVQGTRQLREAAAGWLARRHSVSADPSAVLPVIGSKEFIAALPALLGCGPGDTVVHPELAYPTYDIGARLAGATAVAADGLSALGPRRVALVWVNSPANPTGRVLPAAHLRKMVDWARERGAVIAADECYLDLGWDTEPVSILHPEVCGESARGVLAVHSLSKRSNMAGYRAGFVTGDPALVAEPAGDPPARRDDGARSGAGGNGRRARRRCPRRRAARQVRRAAGAAAGGAGRGGLGD